MINITLIAVGKLKEKYLRDAVDEYSKPVSYTHLTLPTNSRV